MIIKKVSVALLIMVFCFSCDNGNDTDTVSLEVHSATEISETGFTLNWTVSNFEFDLILVEISKDKDLEMIDLSFEERDVQKGSYSLSGLRGATKYYYRITLKGGETLLAESDIRAVETAFYTESITLVTSDMMNLTGKLSYLFSNTEPRPGIIMMHELGAFVNPWVGSQLMKLLISEGYVCLTFFNRGHGSSTPVEELMDLIDDKSLLAKDLDAAITFMHGRDLVRPGNLGLIGASMGGIMALAGNGYPEVKTSVSLSAPADGVFSIFPGMTINSAYYLAGELDKNESLNLDFRKDAENLYHITEDPRKLSIIPGTSDHGTSLLSRDSLNSSIQKWIIETLPLL